MSKLEIGKYCDKCSTFLNRLAAPLASTSLSQLYLALWRVQSRLLAERSRSDNPAQMSIMAYIYSLKRCDVFSVRAIQKICHVVCITFLDVESAEILAGIGGIS
jgi:hypothetical protein